MTSFTRHAHFCTLIIAIIHCTCIFTKSIWLGDFCFALRLATT